MTHGASTDAAIQRAVQSELRWDARVAQTEVGVEVGDGIVTLSGTVSSWTKSVAAEQAAHRAAGVRDVVNALKIRIAGSSEKTDADLAHAVREALSWNASVPHEQVATTVSAGVVTLEGTVASWSEREDAENVVRGMKGVARVVNKLRVAPPATDPQELREAVEHALLRHVERSARGLELQVADGVVRVTGRVDSPRARRAVLGAIQGVHGVGPIDDQLQVQPFRG